MYIGWLICVALWLENSKNHAQLTAPKFCPFTNFFFTPLPFISSLEGVIYTSKYDNIHHQASIHRRPSKSASATQSPPLTSNHHPPPDRIWEEERDAREEENEFWKEKKMGYKKEKRREKELKKNKRGSYILWCQILLFKNLFLI